MNRKQTNECERSNNSNKWNYVRWLVGRAIGCCRHIKFTWLLLFFLSFFVSLCLFKSIFRPREYEYQPPPSHKNTVTNFKCTEHFFWWHWNRRPISLNLNFARMDFVFSLFSFVVCFCTAFCWCCCCFFKKKIEFCANMRFNSFNSHF